MEPQNNLYSPNIGAKPKFSSRNYYFPFQQIDLSSKIAPDNKIPKDPNTNQIMIHKTHVNKNHSQIEQPKPMKLIDTNRYHSLEKKSNDKLQAYDKNELPDSSSTTNRFFDSLHQELDDCIISLEKQIIEDSNVKDVYDINSEPLSNHSTSIGPFTEENCNRFVHNRDSKFTESHSSQNEIYEELESIMKCLNPNTYNFSKKNTFPQNTSFGNSKYNYDYVAINIKPIHNYQREECKEYKTFNSAININRSSTPNRYDSNGDIEFNGITPLLDITHLKSEWENDKKQGDYSLFQSKKGLDIYFNNRSKQDAKSQNKYGVHFLDKKNESFTTTIDTTFEDLTTDLNTHYEKKIYPNSLEIKAKTTDKKIKKLFCCNRDKFFRNVKRVIIWIIIIWGIFDLGFYFETLNEIMSIDHFSIYLTYLGICSVFTGIFISLLFVISDIRHRPCFRWELTCITIGVLFLMFFGLFFILKRNFLYYIYFYLKSNMNTRFLDLNIPGYYFDMK